MTQLRMELDARALLGECPRWNRRDSRLYWVDISRNELHRFDPASGQDEARTFDQPTGCFAFLPDGGFLLAQQSGCALLRNWSAEPEPFGPQIFTDDPARRFNDGRTDPQGRFWAGSVNMPKTSPNAALYRLDGNGSIHEIAGGMTTCNGAAFSADGATFYHTDTPSHALRAYDVDPARGTLSAGKLLHQFPLGQGRPDGGSADEDGCYWSALFDGGRVVRLSPTGEILTEIVLPVSRPTMIAFGGPDRRTAFVTTARTGLSAAALASQPLAGALFSFRVATPGVPETDFALR